MAQQEHVLGTYEFQQDTKNGIHRFCREDESGSTQLQYVLPAVFDGNRPDSIEVVIRWNDGKASRPAARKASVQKVTSSGRTRRTSGNGGRK
jgi:hypothetical protein